jgi:hypothetical protein
MARSTAGLLLALVGVMVGMLISCSGGSSDRHGGDSSSGGEVAHAGASGQAGAESAVGGSDSGEVGGETARGGSGTQNPSIPTHCSGGLPEGAAPVDVSDATTVGTGTPESCTFEELKSAVEQGGKIKFDCGPNPVTIGVIQTMNLPTETDTVIDGGNLVTLDGQDSVQLMRYEHMDWMVMETRVTLQHLTVVRGRATPTLRIPQAPAPCSQGWNDGEGGAIYMRDGNLSIIDCVFSNNHAAELGPDTGGGAIYINGSKHGALIVGSIFTDNSASNAGAIGALFAELNIYDSLFENNTATGNGANNDDPERCDVINNGQHEVGSGGNGGAIYQDGGASTNVLLCGVDVENNAAGEGAFGGGVFMTSNDWSGTITIRDSVVTGNSGGSWTQVSEGSLDLGSAFGVNAKSGSVTNSTLQDAG